MTAWAGLLGIAAVSSAVGYAAAGFDHSFSADGKVLINFNGQLAEADDVAVDRGGKILVAGRHGQVAGVIRLAHDGSRDRSFANGGELSVASGDFETSPRGRTANVAVQRNGKLLATAGTVEGEGVLVRARRNGALDRSFGSDGRVALALFPQAVALQADGRIVVVGQILDAAQGEDDFAIMRLLPNGSPDPTFGDGGTVGLSGFSESETGADVVITKAGRIVVLATGQPDPASAPRWVLLAFDSGGDPDASFGNGGRVEVSGNGTLIAEDLALNRDGHLLAAGTGRAPAARGGRGGFIGRFTADGELDPSFSGNGLASVIVQRKAGITGVSPTQSGDLLFAGFRESAPARRWLIGRMTDNGRLDQGFSKDGLAFPLEGRANALALKRGRALAAGGAKPFGGLPTRYGVVRFR